MDPLASLFDRYRRQGDLQALGAVFDALAPRLLPVALHLCGNGPDAEDALQQTFLLAMDRAAAFDATKRLEPWLAGMLTNVVRNVSRHAGRRRTGEFPELPECASPDLGPLAVAENAELVALLRTHVDALPAEQRQVVRLQLQHGLSPLAIAEALELPPGTVRMRLHRGLESLRKLLPASLAALLAASLPAAATGGLTAVRDAVLAAGPAKWLAAAGGLATAGKLATGGAAGSSSSSSAAAANGTGASGAAAGGTVVSVGVMSSAVVVGGAVMMKKLVVGIVLAGVLGALWWWGAMPPLDSPRGDVAPPPGAGAALAAELPAPARADDAGPAREAVPVAVPAPARTAGEPSPTELWGVVVDAATKAPVAGADVRLEHRENDEFASLDLVRGEHVATLARATSDGEGRFAFEVVRARPHRVHVAAAGYAPVTVPQRYGGSVATIELTRGAVVSGVVTSAGQPVVDVELRLAVSGEAIELAHGRTDGGGTFRFPGLPPARVYVQVRSPRFEEEWKLVVIEAGKEHHVTIELDAGKTLRGRVLDAATSMPVAAAEVTDSWVFRRVVRTDPDGRFELAGLVDQGFVMAHVRAPGYARAAVNVAGKLADELVVRLQRGGEVVGRIVDPAGVPIGAAYVAVCANYWQAPGMQGSDWIPAAVSADGRFQALGLRPDQHYWLLVRCAGKGARVYALPRMLTGGERHDVGDVVLQAGAGIEGRVVDDADQPIAAAEVSVNGTNSDSRAWLAGGAEPTKVSQFEGRSVRTDARGVFRIADLPAGRFEVSARVDRRNGEVSREVTTTDGAQHEDVVLVLPRGKSITGMLLLPTGLPPQNPAELWLLATGREGSHNGQVANDGTFRIDGLPDGEYAVGVLQPPKGLAFAPVQGIAAGTENVRLEFEVASSVAGRVVDADGKPTKARVYALVGEGSAANHTTEDDGTFRLEVPASFRGKVGASSIVDQMVQGKLDDVAAGRTDLVITIAPFGTRHR